jgi:hypothetical protein
MIFCWVRYEIANFLRQICVEAQNQQPDFSGSEFGNPCISLADKLKAIDDFEERLQVKYLNHCDLHTALHIMTRYYAVYAISKMKITAYDTVS